MELQSENRGTAKTLRTAILWTLILSEVGVGAELLLTGHIEGLWQLIPLVLIVASLGLLMGVFVLRRPVVVRAFLASMILCVISGGVGIALHYRAKMEFKLETNPSLAGWELLWQTVTGSAVPPVLAPGVMIQLGLLGLVFAYRNPALTESSKTFKPTSKKP